jgi:hypothetical protein
VGPDGTNYPRVLQKVAAAWWEHYAAPTKVVAARHGCSYNILAVTLRQVHKADYVVLDMCNK